jgi:hypothetical protein
MPNARNLLYHKNNFTALIIQAALYICTLLEFKVCLKFKKLNLKISQSLFSLALQPSAGYGLLVSWGFLLTNNDASQSVGLLWTSDQFLVETST